MRSLAAILVSVVLSMPVAAQDAASCPTRTQLDDLVGRARASNSDGLVVISRGRILVDETFGNEDEPIYISSAGKSLVSMAIGRLLHTGALDSLDQPVWTLFPEWKQGRKQEITIRHLLNHTSGLQNHPNASVELEPAPNWRVADVVRLALAAELTEAPGTVVRYNNKATALLGGVIERASGRRMDTYFEEEFFAPMGITSFDWIRDEAGQPTAHGAFRLSARDLARFGEMMVDGGVYAGRRFFDAAWVDTSFAQSQPDEPRWGLLWWRLPEWTRYLVEPERLDSLRTLGIAQDFLTAVEPLRGRTFEDRAAYDRALEQQLGPDWRSVAGNALASVEFGPARAVSSPEAVAYYADGFRGNFLVVVPEARFVAARIKGPSDDFDFQRDTFHDFVRRAADLGRSCATRSAAQP